MLQRRIDSDGELHQIKMTGMGSAPDYNISVSGLARLVRQAAFDALRAAGHELHGVRPVHPSFRLLATAEPPAAAPASSSRGGESSGRRRRWGGRWLTDEVLSVGLLLTLLGAAPFPSALYHDPSRCLHSPKVLALFGGWVQLAEIGVSPGTQSQDTSSCKTTGVVS